MPRNIARRPFAVAACALATLFYSVVARAQGAVDAFNPGADQIVWSLAAQPDGKIIVGGGFTHLGGGGTTPRNHIGRLNIDGTVDPTFTPGANSIVQAIAVQPDGKILIGGNFSSVGGGNGLGTPRQFIARLNADGTVDANFNPGANNVVYSLVVQPDGKILVGGAFSTMGGGTGTTTRNRLARLNPDGTLDSFDPGASKLPTGAAAIVYSMALQPDGKVVVGGYFNGLGGGTGATVRNYIGRINADGTLDSLFNPGATAYVNALALQADGKIVVGGDFTGLGGGDGTVPSGGSLRGHIGRLNTDGSVDLGFNPGTESEVHTLGVQADGKILAAGYFKWMGGAGDPNIRSVRNYIGRLNADGTVDVTFNPGADNVVESTMIQPDGAIVAGGHFLNVGGGIGTTTPRSLIARFTNTAAIQTLTLSGGGSFPSVETWMRGGSGPEVSRVTFEFSFDGSFYSMLGGGSRISGGWQLTSVNLPTTRTIYLRARGYYGSGYQNGSGSVAEQILIQAPTVMSKREGDFDGDGKTDIAIYRPSTGTWWIQQSSGGYASQAFGLSGDVPVPGDYDGDGKADIAVFRPSTGTWYILKSSNNSLLTTAWGVSGDIPVQGDYDGDGRTDLAIFRPSSGLWYILKSSNNYTTFTSQAWGISTDIPVPGDYDGDGKTDIAIYRPSTGTWYILKSSDNTFIATQWGLSTDIPVRGDFDGDGKTDLAVYRPSSGTWYILQSTAGFVAVSWGISTDLPVPGDYDGDGKTDVAIYRSGTWYVLQSSTNTFVSYSWGVGTDVPVIKHP